MTTRSFLSLNDLHPDEFQALFSRAAHLKAQRQKHIATPSLSRRVLGMIFEKASTRTRVSFEVGMYELGGYAVFLAAEGTQIARGEPIQDTARVLGSYCHAILIRTFGHDRAEALAKWSGVPVINGLTDLLHPCQVATDLFTVWEGSPNLQELKFAWIGDGNNMANSWLNAAGLLGLQLTLACPAGFEPNAKILQRNQERLKKLGRGSITLTENPSVAAENADVISTDVWASMGQESEADQRAQKFQGFEVDSAMLSRAGREVRVLHCLPAHRGEEISEDVLEGKHSVVWQQAENRLHVQKAILEWVFGVN